MTGFPFWLQLAVLFVGANLLFHLVYLMDQRNRTSGPMFTHTASGESRLFAGLVGLVLGISFLIAWGMGFRQGEVVVLGIAAIALAAYSLGITGPLTRIQTLDKEILRGLERGAPFVGLDVTAPRDVLTLVRAGGTFRVYEYCISPLLATLRYRSPIHFIQPGQSAVGTGLRYSLISLALGWVSLFGPIHTISSIRINSRGGWDVTGAVREWFEALDESQRLEFGE